MLFRGDQAVEQNSTCLSWPRVITPAPNHRHHMLYWNLVLFLVGPPHKQHLSIEKDSENWHNEEDAQLSCKESLKHLERNALGEGGEMGCKA